MPKVEIKKNEIWVGRKKIPLISGEVHYWRLNPHYWKEVLACVRRMGIRVISSYIPWDYHEYKHGQFDFTGKTDGTRNLKSFLELTHKEGFWMVIRPGPYIYSEWPREGVPAYAYQYHRLHPKFLAHARNYLKRVCQILKPYLASHRGGHILLLQADNEIDPWPDIFGQQYGLNGRPGLFQKYIQSLYENNLNNLNECWGTRYTSFDEAEPFIATMLNEERGLPLKGDKELKRNIDYVKFKYFYSREYAKWIVTTYRALGIDIPIYLNVYPFFYAHDWTQLQSVCDMVGLDLYPSAEFSEDSFEQRKVMDKARYLRSVSRLPFIAEFGAGVWHNRHYESGILTPNHYRLITLTALLGGIAGWNWYMLVNRDNWYMSPINEWGRVHPELYDVFKQLVGVFGRMHPPTLAKIADVAVTFNPLQYAARTLSHNSAILVSLYDADIDYDLYDPRLGSCKKKLLFYSGNQWLDIASQRNLRHYVEDGGILVAFRNYPRKDDSFHPCSLIGFEDPQSILFEFKRKFQIRLAEGRTEVEVFSSVFTFSDVEGEKIVANLGSYGEQTVGYIRKVGKGKIVHLGFEPSRELVTEILNAFHIPLVTYSPTQGIKTALFKRKNYYYLVVCNNGDENKSASIYLPALNHRRRKMVVRNLVEDTHEVYSYERRMPFSVEIPRKDGKVFEFCPMKTKTRG
jgi:beta-galactosidase